MQALPVIAVFDIGKTNKKLLLFNEAYQVVFEESVCMAETVDEDGFPCEDLQRLSGWIADKFVQLLQEERYQIRAVNFSAYGASFVHLDETGQPCLPLYNYLKPYPQELQAQFYNTYGGEDKMATETASPILGNLNSGMQLYWLKYAKPELFVKIKSSLHLPQYCSYLLTGSLQSDITSIGCHTNLWNFAINNYHEWTEKEKIQQLLPPIVTPENAEGISLNSSVVAGGGLHDSSAALIPYLSGFDEPFLLISTGTWCISLNPFNDSILTIPELKMDCLCYLAHNGKPVKASRIFAGNYHEQQVKRLAAYFDKPAQYYNGVKPDIDFLLMFLDTHKAVEFDTINLDLFNSYDNAYQLLVHDIVKKQKESTMLVLKSTAVKKIFVDGGFSKNPLYMQLLAEAFAGFKVYAATVAQASATGAAMVIHQHWNSRPLPDNIIELKLYEPGGKQLVK